jgi:ArsR family transcriptional regulator
MNYIEIFKALADPTRLKILECIKNEEKCICEIIPYTGKSQPNVSIHLKVLKQAGLVNERKDGTKIMLSISDKHIFELIKIAKQIN